MQKETNAKICNQGRNKFNLRTALSGAINARKPTMCPPELTTAMQNIAGEVNTSFSLLQNIIYVNQFYVLHL